MPQAATNALRQATALIEVRRFADAAGLVQRIIASEPGSAQPRCLLAQCRLGLDDPAGALEAASGAVSVSPEGEWGHRLRSIALLRLNRKKEALAAARQAVTLAPRQSSAYLVLTDAELANRHLDEARRAAETARELAPDSAGGHNAVGLVALRLRRFRNAEESFRTALGRDPEHAQAMNNLGVALLRQGRKPQAIHYFAEASRLDPRFTAPRRNAVGAARAGTAVVVVAAIANAPRVMNAARSRPLPRVLPGIVALGSVVRLVRRFRRGPRADDPKASKRLMRDLRREAGTGGVRIGRLARSLGLSILFLFGMVVCIGGAGGVAGGDVASGGAVFLIGAACLALLGFLVKRSRSARH
jgi:tetratricopeptide (TPR) repeat protein